MFTSILNIHTHIDQACCQWPGDQGKMLDPVYNIDTVSPDAFVFGVLLRMIQYGWMHQIDGFRSNI